MNPLKMQAARIMNGKTPKSQPRVLPARRPTKVPPLELAAMRRAIRSQKRGR